MTTVNNNVLFLLKDERGVRSPNLQAFFKTKNGKKMANHLEVIRWKKDHDRLWFVTLGWLVTIGNEKGFAGVSVIEVACKGKNATTSYPIEQTGDML